MIRTIDIDLVYQPLIDGPPKREGNLYERACQSDSTTVNHWRKTWLEYYKINSDKYGNFNDHSIGKLFGVNRHRPAIVCGSGPSLKNQMAALKESRDMEFPIMMVSCLHNFGYFEDHGFHADYYISIDSGDIVIKDVTEGCKEAPEYYWEKTEDKTLLASVTSDPKLLEKWRGPIYLFNVLIPDELIMSEFNRIQRFSHYISCGGNALGGCVYFAKSIASSDVMHIVGGDFCFDYNNTFHAYKTHYDDLGHCVPWPDVYGILRKTWPSYLNFKFWLDNVACTVPGRWISCSEGLLGAYREGNIKQFAYMSLHDALVPYKMTERMYLQRLDRKTNEVLDAENLNLKDLFNDSQYDKDIVMF